MPSAETGSSLSAADRGSSGVPAMLERLPYPLSFPRDVGASHV